MAEMEKIKRQVWSLKGSLERKLRQVITRWPGLGRGEAIAGVPTCIIFVFPAAESWESHPEVLDMIELQRQGMTISGDSLAAGERATSVSGFAGADVSNSNKFELLKGSSDDSS